MLDFSTSLWFLVLQWVYALWQAMRNTRGFNLFYYTMQWLLLQLRARIRRREDKIKLAVWVNPTHCSRDYRWQREFETLAPELLSKKRYIHGMDFLGYKDFWYKLRYNGKYYWVPQDVFFELCCYDLKECYFVKDLYDLDRNYSVAERITEEEAMLMMFNKNMHLYEVTGSPSADVLAVQHEHYYSGQAVGKRASTSARGRTVIHGRKYNIEFNSKIGGFLATVPLILQARGLSGLSAIATLALLCVDFFRTPLYRSFDKAFFHLTKAVKLRVLGKRSWMYTLLGLFSDQRCNVSKGYAYLTQEGDEIEVTSYVSFFEEGDCELQGLNYYGQVIRDMQCFTIHDGRIFSAGFNYGHYITAIFKVKQGMFVS